MPGRAWAYDRRPDGTFALNSPQNERAGAGGLFTTVRELARWDENFYDGRVGGLDVIRMLETPGRLNSGTELTYAWGLMVGCLPRAADCRAQRLARWVPGTHHPVPERAHVGGGAVQRVQCQHGRRRPARGRCVLAGRDITLPTAPPPPPPPGLVPSGPAYLYEGDELKAFAGEYYSEELESIYRVSVDGTTLKLRRGVQRQVFTLVPRRKDEFDLPGSVIRFRRGPDGAVTGLVVDADRTRGLASRAAGPGGRRSRARRPGEGRPGQLGPSGAPAGQAKVTEDRCARTTVVDPVPLLTPCTDETGGPAVTVTDCPPVTACSAVDRPYRTRSVPSRSA